MAYEQGNIPDLRSEHREHRFSWKALVVVLITLAIVLVPIASIAGWIQSVTACVSPTARKGGGSTSDLLGRRGGGLALTNGASSATALNLESLMPPYLRPPSSGAGTFPPFDFVSGGTAAR